MVFSLFVSYCAHFVLLYWSIPGKQMCAGVPAQDQENGGMLLLTRLCV